MSLGYDHTEINLLDNVVDFEVRNEYIIATVRNVSKMTRP